MSFRRIAKRVVDTLLGTRIGWVVTVVVLAGIDVAFADLPPVLTWGWIVTAYLGSLVNFAALLIAWRLTVHYPIGRRLPRWHLFPHALAAVGYVVADYLTVRIVAAALDPANPHGALSIRREIGNTLLSYVLMAGVTHGIEYVRRYRASRAAELRLRAELADAARERAEAEFRALKAEINPQRMSEALSHVAMLLPMNPAEAERSVVRLGDLMREAMSRRRDDEPSSTLAIERDPADEVNAPGETRGAVPAARARGFMLLGLFWLTLFAVFAPLNIAAARRSGLGQPLYGLLFESLFYATVMTAELYTARRIIRGSGQGFAVRAHLLAAGVFAVVGGLARPLFFVVIGPPYRLPALARLVSMTVFGAVQYAMIATIVAAFEYGRRFATAEASGLALRAQLAETAHRRADAELRALTMELNPHFLANALATVAALIRTDAAGAQRVIAQIDATLREAIARVGVHEVPLGEEIEGLTPFLAVERARFGERLDVSWEVEDEARMVRVPHRILQPLIENAVKHGIAARQGPGRIAVTGRRVNGHLELSVRDDGIGIEGATSRTRGTGIGLTNTRARLEQLYGREARLDVIPAPDVGTIVRLSLPWRSADDALAQRSVRS